MLLINPRIVILQGTGSQVTPGFPHSQIRLQVASPKVREHSRTMPMTYELASDTYYGLGVVTNVGVVMPYDPQDRSSQLLNGPLSAPSPEPAPQPCLSLMAVIMPPNDYLIVPSMPSRAPQSQSTSANAMGQCEKKNQCSLCKLHLSQPQVLSCHMKDKHEDKESCLFCSSFKRSQGRPYLYRYHLQM